MKTHKNILIVFLLNLLFSLFEFVGGIITGSVALTSDAVHDLGDALSIGISYLLERKSKSKPDCDYTYGYLRYSVLGSIFTTMILLLGSVAVIYNAITRIFNPVPINYNGVIIFAVIGLAVNFFAAFITRNKESINQKAVNLHMLEDMLGWIVVLIGAVVMRFTDFAIIDPLLSIAVALYIFTGAVKILKQAMDLFLEKSPPNLNLNEIKAHICSIDGVDDVHHIHLWSLDGITNIATMHIVTDIESTLIKGRVREELEEFGISHSTLEIEKNNEKCCDEICNINLKTEIGHHCHHSHKHS